MNTEMRKTGVDVVGDMPWGTHFCVFYDSTADLLETLVAYCRAGLENGEFCMWVVAAPVTEEDAKRALARGVPDFERYERDGSIEIVTARDWYLQDGEFDLERVIDGWMGKLASALAHGHTGARVTGDTVWLEKNDWKDFTEYEETLNVTLADRRISALCTYPLGACGADEILDVVRTHQFAVTKRRGSWEVIETAGHREAKAEIERLNEDLERRVVERTTQLTVANAQLIQEALERQRAEEALRDAQAALARASRLTTMGELAASLSHELRQPLAAIVMNGSATVRWLDRDPPDLEEARAAAVRIAQEGQRADEVIRGLRALAGKSGLQLTALDLDDAIQEVLVLTRSEMQRHGVVVHADLNAGHVPTVGDRVQLQQVLLNLIVNGIEAMGSAPARTRELTVSSAPAPGAAVVVSVEDTGTGLDRAIVDRVFEPFFTTKPDGLGMGLSICRSIIEAHGGRLWMSPRAPCGTAVSFTVPVGVAT